MGPLESTIRARECRAQVWTKWIKNIHIAYILSYFKYQSCNARITETKLDVFRCTHKGKIHIWEVNQNMIQYRGKKLQEIKALSTFWMNFKIHSSQVIHHTWTSWEDPSWARANRMLTLVFKCWPEPIPPTYRCRQPRASEWPVLDTTSRADFSLETKGER